MSEGLLKKHGSCEAVRENERIGTQCGVHPFCEGLVDNEFLYLLVGGRKAGQHEAYMFIRRPQIMIKRHGGTSPLASIRRSVPASEVLIRRRKEERLRLKSRRFNRRSVWSGREDLAFGPAASLTVR